MAAFCLALILAAVGLAAVWAAGPEPRYQPERRMELVGGVVGTFFVVVAISVARYM